MSVTETATSTPDDLRRALLESCKELREALAASMRVIAILDDTHPGDDLTTAWAHEMQRIGIKNGIGVRADSIIAKSEGR